MSGQPNLFIIGAPKCGTTSLYNYLNAHPSIFMSEEKEPHYYNTTSSYRFKTNKADYLSLFDKGVNSKYRGEASVWYFYFKESIINILAENPKAKFIFLTRNHVELFFSLHRELVYIGEENQLDPENAWDLQDSRKAGRNIPISNIEPRLLYYKDICKLDDHLEALKNLIPEANLHVSSLNKMKENFDEFIKEIFSFLEIEIIVIDNMIHNSSNNKGRKSISIQRILRLIYKVKRKFNIPFSLGVLDFINNKNQTKRDLIIKSPSDIFVARLATELK